MKVSTKGQVTIPLYLREKVGIVSGSEVEFSEEKGRLFVRKVKESGRGKALAGRMVGQGSVNMSTDEILTLTRGRS